VLLAAENAEIIDPTAKSKSLAYLPRYYLAIACWFCFTWTNSWSIVLSATCAIRAPIIDNMQKTRGLNHNFSLTRLIATTIFRHWLSFELKYCIFSKKSLVYLWFS
jgi:hypothetical protein